MTRKTGVIIGLCVALAAALGVVWQIRDRGQILAPPPAQGSVKEFTVSRERPPAPVLPLIAADGKAVTLADFRGRIVVVNFWATWCAPCVKEMPSLERLKARLPPDAQVMALSQDLRGWSVITPFVEKIGLKSLPIYFDPEGAVARAMGVTVLPTTVIIGRDGRMEGYLVGAVEWDSDEAVKLVRFYLEGKTP
jgi:thiol-disulfide isomerase/thioredoxin